MGACFLKCLVTLLLKGRVAGWGTLKVRSQHDQDIVMTHLTKWTWWFCVYKTNRECRKISANCIVCRKKNLILRRLVNCFVLACIFGTATKASKTGLKLHVYPRSIVFPALVNSANKLDIWAAPSNLPWMYICWRFKVKTAPKRMRSFLLNYDWAFVYRIQLSVVLINQRASVCSVAKQTASWLQQSLSLWS